MGVSFFYLFGRRAKGTPSPGRSYLSVQTAISRNNGLFSTQVPHLCIKLQRIMPAYPTQIHVICCQTKPHFVLLESKSRKHMHRYLVFVQIAVSLAFLCTFWCFMVSCLSSDVTLLCYYFFFLFFLFLVHLLQFCVYQLSSASQNV